MPGRQTAPAEGNRGGRPLATFPWGGPVLFSPNPDRRFESEKEIRRPNKKPIARGRGFLKSGGNAAGLANLDKERFPFAGKGWINPRSNEPPAFLYPPDSFGINFYGYDPRREDEPPPS